MSFQLTEQAIKLLCGRFAYEEGEVYNREGKVKILHPGPESSAFDAIVKETRSPLWVNVQMNRNGQVDAKCPCPEFHPDDQFCKHIAAVLINIQNSPTLGMSTGDMGLTSKMFELFGDKALLASNPQTRFDIRAPLDVEIICSPFTYGNRKWMFGIEIKIGQKRLYVVQKIRELLDRIDRREAYALSRHFTYDPELHRFEKENEAIIRQLIQIYRNEKMYSETSSHNSYQTHSYSGDRMLLIPPFSWETLLPLLVEAPGVKLEQGDRTFHGIRLSDEPIPLHFGLDQTQSESFQLDVQGLDGITVMEAYGLVLYEGKLLKLQANLCKSLSELQKMLEASHSHQIQIPTEQLEAFMEKVIPGLMKLGRVTIGQAVSDRIVQPGLKARLYLDRVKDRLLAGLEFQYGDIIINPLDANASNRGSERILMRDRDQEERIMELMEQGSFVKTESGFFMDGEDGEYDFLVHVVPQLDKLVEIYATTAVKARLHTGHTAPKVKVNLDERTDWLEFRFEMEGIPESDIRNVLKSLEEKRKYYRLPNGALLPLESAEFQEIIRFMNEAGIRNMDVKGTTIRLPVVRGLHLMDSQEKGHAVKLGNPFRQFLDNMRNPDNLDFPVPDSLAPVLRDYQKYGFQWMKTLANYRFGGILADDMGLGKTLQSIAFIVSVLPEIREQKLPAFIVCPASLVYNWRNELKKFATEIRAVIVDGSRAERDSILKDVSEVDVIITSYPLLRKDIDLYGEQLFHTLILDEGQAFKNHTTQTAQSVKAIKARHRFALTGTPVENRIEELWSIFDVVFPELFTGRKAFNELSREAVAKRVRPFLLRRLKTDVLKELPDKIESLQASELLPEQKKLYVAYLAKLQKETLKHLSKDDFQKNRIKILAGLTRLRQLCCHPALFVEGYDGGSAKFEQLMEIIEECRSSGKRMLVFSQFTEMLGLIGRELGDQGIPHFYLDGRTPSSDRIELCSRFNEGERDLFLISLKAGGTGLNLTGADTVILYDLWWNPAVEQQAADRAHRIGQKNVVQVIRLVTQGTVEDKMYELQLRKKNLIDDIIQPGQEALSSLTEQEIREILMIG